MTRDEMMQLLEARRVPGPQPVNLVALLQDKTDRTLIWGYTPDRHSFHVYLQDATIIRLVYPLDGNPDVQVGADFLPDTLVPSKRVYPDASDGEFCRILQEHGVHIPFTEFRTDRAAKRFHGQTLEDFGKTLADYAAPAPVTPGLR